VAACLAAGWAGTHFAPRRLLPDLGAGALVVSALLFAGALAIGLAGLREFHRHGTPSNPFKPTVTVVTGGIFRFTRNPMYLSFVLIGLAAAIATNSIWFAVATAVLALLLELLVIRPEERYLASRFGSTYEEYRRSTRRWL
jgi:protein-S-isoprenylcysteine O-methyltransferase Ste14